MKIIKRYQKVLARLALSASLLVSVGSAKAIAQNQFTGQSTGLTSQELLSGGRGLVRVPNHAILFPPVSRIIAPKAVRPQSVNYSQPPQRIVTPVAKSAEDRAVANDFVVTDAIAPRQAIAPPQTIAPQNAEATPKRAAAPNSNAAASEPTSNLLAQLTSDQIRERLLIEPNEAVETVSRRARPIPASSFLTPTAYGADWGDAYIGIAQVTGGRPASSNFDGSAAIGVGFGDAVKNVGVEVSTSIISLNGIGEDGIIGFKLHKVFPKANNLAVALGWSNPIKWGDAEERDDHYYGVVTKQFDLRPNRDNTLPLTASVGLGTTGLYRAPTTNTDNNSLGIFGSLGLRVIPDVSLITTWTGTSMGIAASATPFDIPFVMTIGASDITNRTVEGPRFNSSIGYSFSF